MNQNPYAERDCATPNCSEPDGQGTTLRFCGPCAIRLAQIRTEFDADEAAKSGRAYRIYGSRYLLGDGERDDS